MDRRRAWSELLALLAAEVLAVVVLHRLGRVDGLTVPWSSLRDWLDGAPPDEVVAATLRMVALVIAWWLLASTVLYLLASASGAPRAARTIAFATLPVARRWTHRALAASVVAGTVLGIRPVSAAPPPPIGPAPSPPATVLELDHRAPSRSGPAPTIASGRSGRMGGLESAPLVVPPTPAPPPAIVPTSPPVEPPAIGASYVVVGGDSLWSIAASHLARLTGRVPGDVDDHEIATYWTAVVETNREGLRSHDPNLIFPGEVLDLPPAAP